MKTETMNAFRKHNWIVIAAVLMLHCCRRIHAADTVEPFDLGATDFELYTGVEGLGLGKYEKSVFGDMVLGYGILNRLSGYAGTTLSANESFAEGAVEFSFGMYGNVVDTIHFDADLFMDFSGATGDYSMTPSLELNVDADPEMRSFGVYLRSGIRMYGRNTAEETAPETEYEFASLLDGTVGIYQTLKEAHQLLLEYDMRFRPTPLAEEHVVEVGGLAFGYNVMLADNLELVNQLYLDIPLRNESFAMGFSIGCIATLP